MGLVTMTMATVIAGGNVACLPPLSNAPIRLQLWSLPSESLPASRLLINLSVAEFVAGPVLESAMRAAVLTSTEHKYDL